MFKHVLVCVDGSDASQKAVERAIQMYQEITQAQFTILYVDQPEEANIIAGVEVIDHVPQTFQQNNIKDSKKSPSYQSLQQFPDMDRVDCKDLRGNPAQEIRKEAESGGYDLIVLGSKGHGLVSSVVLGSVSAKVLHRSPCSILVVR